MVQTNLEEHIHWLENTKSNFPSFNPLKNLPAVNSSRSEYAYDNFPIPANAVQPSNYSRLFSTTADVTANTSRSEFASPRGSNAANTSTIQTPSSSSRGDVSSSVPAQRNHVTTPTQASAFGPISSRRPIFLDSSDDSIFVTGIKPSPSKSGSSDRAGVSDIQNSSVTPSRGLNIAHLDSEYLAKRAQTSRTTLNSRISPRTSQQSSTIGGSSTTLASTLQGTSSYETIERGGGAVAATASKNSISTFQPKAQSTFGTSSTQLPNFSTTQSTQFRGFSRTPRALLSVGNGGSNSISKSNSNEPTISRKRNSSPITMQSDKRRRISPVITNFSNSNMEPSGKENNIQTGTNSESTLVDETVRRRTEQSNQRDISQVVSDSDSDIEELDFVPSKQSDLSVSQTSMDQEQDKDTNVNNPINSNYSKAEPTKTANAVSPKPDTIFKGSSSHLSNDSNSLSGTKEVAAVQQKGQPLQRHLYQEELADFLDVPDAEFESLFENSQPSDLSGDAERSKYPTNDTRNDQSDFGVENGLFLNSVRMKQHSKIISLLDSFRSELSVPTSASTFNFEDQNLIEIEKKIENWMKERGRSSDVTPLLNQSKATPKSATSQPVQSLGNTHDLNPLAGNGSGNMDMRKHQDYFLSGSSNFDIPGTPQKPKDVNDIEHVNYADIEEISEDDRKLHDSYVFDDSLSECDDFEIQKVLESNDAMNGNSVIISSVSNHSMNDMNDFAGSEFSTDIEEVPPHTFSQIVDPEDESRNTYPWNDEVKDILRHTFKLSSFRTSQLTAINTTLNGDDVFVLMPTGGGKSLCYQLPALVKSGKTKGLTIVISPLVSLMQDQVSQLESMGIGATRIERSTTSSEWAEMSDGIESGRLKIIYLSPEMLEYSGRFRSILEAQKRSGHIARFVVDEAHCISSWGHDFRKSYQHIYEIKSSFPNVPIMALTATANEQTQQDIMGCFRNKSKTKVLIQSFNRPNLSYEVRPKGNQKQTINDIGHEISTKYQGQTGIIYCYSKKDCETVAQELGGLIRIDYYHGDLETKKRKEVQEKWKNGELQVVCATVAFGMGIDKAEVRFVYHLTLPRTIEGYYQETGRAGRDGKPSKCILYFSEGDAQKIRKNIMDDKDVGQDSRDHNSELFEKMVQLCRNHHECLRKQVLGYFLEDFDVRKCNKTCGNCIHRDNCTIERLEIMKEARELSEIVRNYDKLTYNQVSDLYYGKKGTNNFNIDFNRIPFGKGKDLGKIKITRIVLEMLSSRVFEEYLGASTGKFNYKNAYLKLGSEYKNFIDGRKKIGPLIMLTEKPNTGTTFNAPKPKRKTASSSSTRNSTINKEQFSFVETTGAWTPVVSRSTTSDSAHSNDTVLFRRLEVKRLVLAKEFGKSPEEVCSDNVLKTLAHQRPTSKYLFGFFFLTFY